MTNQLTGEDKANIVRQLASVAYSDHPSLYSMTLDNSEAYGAAWSTWTRGVRRLILSHINIGLHWGCTAGASLTPGECYLWAVNNKTGFSMTVSPAAAGGLTVRFGAADKSYHIPTCSPAEFVIWMCQHEAI
jgi:hypothetical protein